MLDNMSVQDMADAVRHITGRALTGLGQYGRQYLREVAACVDFISIGALTNSAKALDMWSAIHLTLR